ncbi:N-acetylmuramoyl-L-alanine amidase [Lysobacter sp. H23M47]|uniref:N-acetylmuramoyl-L-alanine amidase n=1 Tax=Lysobacter sp. H23M47 TaxID=2781024 RepID=UPI00187F509D|nr:N-acetylmuramoyl-L-alanine amidase [Lysobacter sp. H23M47]QOW23741.1 N-acetylmuramoyl-L-alanine amidase [Lysobacter sp. H23M47]
MRVQSPSLRRVLLSSTLIAACAAAAVNASEIKGLQLNAGATGTRAEIALDAPGEFKVISLAGPDRLVIDMPASSVSPTLSVPAGAGVVKSVRTGKPVPGTARVVFDLSQTITALKPRIEQSGSGPVLVVEWPGDGAPASVPAAAVAASVTPTQSPSADSTAAAAQMMAPVTTPTPTPTPVDTAASAEATSRLISQIAAANAAASARELANRPSPQAASMPSMVAVAPAPVRATPPPAASAPPAATAPVKTIQQVMQGQGMRPLVIAIDPGHGGQDPGAIGKGGTREKDVVLAISKELARQINATPGLKAYMTREHDVFIPLNKRAALARAAKADMFISIHADAAENRSADGSSVYVLSLRGASSQRARWLADKENSADLIGGARMSANTTLASVLLDLTQSGHMKASEDAAGQILDGLKRVGNVHKPSIERANFAVLRTSDMPAMLVETAFISNATEEIRLKDPAFQRKVAGAVLDGVNTFFTRQPPPGTMFAARAAALETASASITAGGSP